MVDGPRSHRACRTRSSAFGKFEAWFGAMVGASSGEGRRVGSSPPQGKTSCLRLQVGNPESGHGFPAGGRHRTMYESALPEKTVFPSAETATDRAARPWTSN